MGIRRSPMAALASAGLLLVALALGSCSSSAGGGSAQASGEDINTLGQEAVFVPESDPGAYDSEGVEVGFIRLRSGFESGAVGDWHGRGKAEDGTLETVAPSQDAAHTGKWSLKISDRTKTWQGPMHHLAVEPKPGQIYRMSMWIYFNEGPETSNFNFSVQKSYGSSADRYQNLTFVKANKGEWTYIDATYVTPDEEDLKLVQFYFELPWKSSGDATADDTISFYVDDVILTQLDPAKQPKIEPDIPSLAEVWADYFDLGVAISADQLDPTTQNARLIMKHFKTVTPGNSMKWDSTQPTEGDFKLEGADKVIDFGGMTGMAIRGHTLVWHQQTPAWVFQDPEDATKPASRELVIERMQTHIQEVAGGYSGFIKSWDVINECLSDSHPGLRTADESVWAKAIGPEFVELAFKFAKEADSEAQLVINDYNLVSNKTKRESMYKLVKDLKAKGVPIDGIGMQMHINLYSPPVNEIRETFQLFSTLGVKVLVTELDMSIYSGADEPFKKPTREILVEQAKRYQEIFEVFKEYSKKGILDQVVIWGSSDAHTWLDNHPVLGRNDAPILFDRKLKAKPAYWALVDPSKI